jgi:pimeloyl-ACP methyl ester carboxylesterase
MGRNELYENAGVTSVLYFHGFASSPASAKITALRPLLAPLGIELNTPDLNVPSFERLDFDLVVDRAYEEALRLPPAAMVGSSLGSLVALSVAKRGVYVPLVLIAPALGVARRWKERLPDGDPVIVFNYARNADAPIHRAFFEQMANLHVDDDPPPCRVTAIMGRKDQTVPFDIVEETWRKWEASGKLVPGSRFVELEEGDHALVEHAELIRAAIQEAAHDRVDA